MVNLSNGQSWHAGLRQTRRPYDSRQTQDRCNPLEGDRSPICRAPASQVAASRPELKRKGSSKESVGKTRMSFSLSGQSTGNRILCVRGNRPHSVGVLYVQDYLSLAKEPPHAPASRRHGIRTPISCTDSQLATHVDSGLYMTSVHFVPTDSFEEALLCKDPLPAPALQRVGILPVRAPVCGRSAFPSSGNPPPSVPDTSFLITPSLGTP